MYRALCVDVTSGPLGDLLLPIPPAKDTELHAPQERGRPLRVLGPPNHTAFPRTSDTAIAVAMREKRHASVTEKSDPPIAAFGQASSVALSATKTAREAFGLPNLSAFPTRAKERVGRRRGECLSEELPVCAQLHLNKTTVVLVSFCIYWSRSTLGPGASSRT